MGKKKIALVQFYGYHEEVLAPQINFLLPENEVFVAAPTKVLNHDYLKKFTINRIEFKDKTSNPSHIFSKLWVKAQRRIFIMIFMLYCCAKINKFDLIIFNTIEDKFYHLKLILFFFKRFKKIHLIHNLTSYLNPPPEPAEKIHCLARFDKNLFISKEVYEYCAATILSRYTIDLSLFDWFFPGLWGLHSGVTGGGGIPLDRNLRFVVPGNVTQYRRNYQGLFETMEKLQNQYDVLPFEIILLGQCPNEIKNYIDGKGLKNIKTFDRYVDGDMMIDYLESADAVLFLIDKEIGESEKGEKVRNYNRGQISGTSVICLSFGIPCVSSDDFKIDEALKEKAVMYSGSNIESFFKDIITGVLTKDSFKALKTKAISPPDIYSFDFQKRLYNKMVENVLGRANG
jgi:glycosyltransferase involved in cell wall biosynthesis